MTACLGPHMPFTSLMPILSVGSSSRLDTLPRMPPISAEDRVKYPTTQNPFYRNKVNETGTGVVEPTTPIYSDSWEERIRKRDEGGEAFRAVQQREFERSGLAALGYTHNGLGPVPPLFVDTDEIRGKGKEVPEYLRFLTVFDYKAMDAAVRQARGQGVLPHFETVQTPTKENPIEVSRRNNPRLGGEEELIKSTRLGIQMHTGPTGMSMRNLDEKVPFFRVYPTGGGIEHYRSPDGSIDIPRLIKEGSVDLSKL